MKPFAVLLVLIANRFTALTPEKEKKLPDPTPRKAEILKQFAGDFIALTPGTGKFPASFLMGSKAGREELPIHKVTIAYSFSVNKFEITQELYHVVMGKNPSKWKGLRNAVEVVSWA